MIKIVTSVTVFNDAVGKRISVSYSEVNEETGMIISDNNRVDRVVTDASAKATTNELVEFAQGFLDQEQ